MGQQESIQELITFSVPLISIDKEVLSTLTDSTLGYVDLSRGKWEKLSLEKVMPKIQVWKIKKGIVMDENNQPCIVKQIENIKFPFLIELALRKNNIESLEGFCRIDAPNIERLWFCDNKITTVKTLRKANFPNLRYLCQNLNELHDLNKFAQHNSPYLEELFITVKHRRVEHFLGITKFRTKNLNKIYMQKLENMNAISLQKKYGQLTFREQSCEVSQA